MEKSLLLTLGHNSSAVLVHDNNIVCGYEEERLSGVKSDSRFPVNAITECMKHNGERKVHNVYVTHWDPFNSVNGMKPKYWRKDLLPPHDKLISHGGEFTHHDCHANAALWYAKSKPGMEDAMILVVDGFGNYGEHLSIYKIDEYGEPYCIKRMFGYDTSLGLMYQYMTAFLGMKMHEDEYKILGYEVHIDKVDVDKQRLEEFIEADVVDRIKLMFDPLRITSKHDPVLSLDALPTFQFEMVQKWSQITKLLDIDKVDDYVKRVVMGYYVQRVLEAVILTVIKIYAPSKLIVTGGVFYNVRLNRVLTGYVQKLCAFPLAGDQGNALGLYYSMNKGLKWPGHLNWGIRPPASKEIPPDGFIYADASDFDHRIILQELDDNGMINVVRGAMEFGPRAMCNTSTLAIPTLGIVERINYVNGRNTVMPMAPVVNRQTYEQRFMMTDRIHVSEQHMITALPYTKFDDVLGAAHIYKLEATGRPQVYDQPDWLQDVLASHNGILINTSYNVHGKPIVFSCTDAMVHHMKQYEKDQSIKTVYIGE